MTALPFAEWTPDAGLAANAYVRNAAPTAGGWQAIPSPVDTLREALSTLDPAWRCTYLGAHYSSAGNVLPVVGLADGLATWAPDGTLSYLDAGTLTTPAETNIRVVQWGDYLYYVNGYDPIHRIDLEGGPPIVVPGLPSGLGFYELVECRNFLVGADEVHSGGIRNPFSVRWSGLQRPEMWDPSAATQADQQDLSARGANMGMTGGAFLTVLMEKAIVRGDYVGPPLYFEFQDIDTNFGCRSRNSVIKVGTGTYWLSEAGFRVSTGGESQPIGLGVLDRWFFRNAKENALGRMSATYFASIDCVGWLFETNQAQDGFPDFLLLYSRKLGRWGNAQIGVQFIGNTGSSFTSLDMEPWASMSIDDPAFLSLDSDFFKGARGTFAAIGRNGECLAFSGLPMAAVMETKEIGDMYSRRGLHRAVPLLDGGGTVTVEEVTRRDAMDNQPAIGPVRRLNRQGFVPLFRAGKGARLRATLAGPWYIWRGFDVS